MRLAGAVDWKRAATQFEQSRIIPFDGRSLPSRLLLGLALLRQLYGLSEEALLRQWADNPYFQYFCGAEVFQHQAPFDLVLIKMLPPINDRELQALLDGYPFALNGALSSAQQDGHVEEGIAAATADASPARVTKSNGARPPRINEVAKRAGVSVKTVSMLLNHPNRVSKRTRDAIGAAMRDLSYKPNVFARGLASPRSNLVALLYDGPGEFLLEFATCALEHCRNAGYHLTLESLSAHQPDLRQKMGQVLAGSDLHGAIVLAPLCDEPSVIEELMAAHISFVRVGPGKLVQGIPTVGANEHRIGYDMTAYLIGIGHKRIGFIGGRPDHLAAMFRQDGYRAALKAFSLPFDRALCQQGLFTLESGRSAAERLLSLKNRPTAIFAAGDQMAAGVLAQAQKMGLKVPDQLSIVGVDDSVIAQTVWPQLTSCHTPIHEMASAAVSVLLRKPNDAGPLTTVLSHKLIVRGSTARLGRPR